MAGWLREGRRVAARSAAGLLVVAGTLAAAQSPPQGPVRPAGEAAEVALALSALPESMRAGAAVHVLGPNGYRQARSGTTGINCLVEQSRPDTQEPICWDREGSETIMPAVMARAEWRAKGASDAEIERRVNDGFAAGTFRAPRRAGLAYMLSAHNWVYNGQRVIHYQPHVMAYAPYLRNADLGVTGSERDAPWVLHEGSPHAYIIIDAKR